MDAINLLFLWIATYFPDIKDDYIIKKSTG